MGSKRRYDDTNEEEHELSSPGSGIEPAAKRPKSSGKGAPGSGLGQAKKRARSIKRQLTHDIDLPEDVRQDLERELAVHESVIAEHAFQKKRAAMISKYHMVRFFGKFSIRFGAVTRATILITSGSVERKKAMRHAKQLKKRIDKADDPATVEQLQHELHVAEVDQAYAQHFPHAETYISLFPKAQRTEDEAASAAESTSKSQKPPMWAVIEKAMEEGPQALKKIRERRPLDETAAEKKKKQHDNKPTSTEGRAPSTSASEKMNNKPLPMKLGGKQGGQQPMNRRQRRQLMREMAPVGGDGENEGESFFE
jgi:hypothetical protein